MTETIALEFPFWKINICEDLPIDLLLQLRAPTFYLIQCIQLFCLSCYDNACHKTEGDCWFWLLCLAGPASADVVGDVAQGGA